MLGHTFGLLGFSYAVIGRRSNLMLDPMNRGLLPESDPIRRLAHTSVTNLDPMNRGLLQEEVFALQAFLKGYKPRPDE